MRGILPKSLLALTSFAPLLCIIAIKHFLGEQTLLAADLFNDTKTIWMILVFDIAVFLFFICWKMMKRASRRGHIFPLEIQEFNRRGQGILVFMFIYLLPLIRSPDSLFANWQTTIGTLMVFAFIILIINPSCQLLNLHGFSVKLEGIHPYPLQGETHGPTNCNHFLSL